MKLPPLSSSLLARQTPEVRAALDSAGRKRKAKLSSGAVMMVSPSQTPAVLRDDGTIEVTIPGVRLPSLANLRSTWGRAECVRRARAAVFHVEVFGPRLAAAHGSLCSIYDPTSKVPLPWEVTITRIAPRQLDDDNAVGAAKGVRDAIAAWCGVDDRRPQVRYIVEQEKGPIAVRIVVRSLNNPELGPSNAP